MRTMLYCYKGVFKTKLLSSFSERSPIRLRTQPDQIANANGSDCVRRTMTFALISLYLYNHIGLQCEDQKTIDFNAALHVEQRRLM